MFTPKEIKVVSSSLQEAVEFIHENLRASSTLKDAMEEFDADPYITALVKVDPKAAAKIRKFVVSDLRDYIEEN